MNDEATYQLIEQYLAGELSDAERNAFEQRLKEDKVLAAETELHHRLHESLAGEKIHELRAVLQEVDEEWDRSSKVRNLFPARWLYAAAAVILVLVASVLYINRTRHLSPEELFAQSFEPYQMVLNQRSFKEDEDILNAAINAYERGDYDVAVEKFSELKSVDSLGVAPKFYTAISWLALQQPEKAIDLLSSIATQDKHLLSEQARWYLVMAYLASGDKTSAQRILGDMLGNERHFKQEEVGKLLEELAE